jgi:peptidylprolyl isomerase
MLLQAVSTIAVLLVSTACASGPRIVRPIESSALAASVGVDLAEYTRTEDGLYFRDIVQGDGEVAAPASIVTVAYRLLLASGAQVDSSTGVIVRLAHDRIVEGWKLGIPGMRVGGARVLVLPPELGYSWREVGNIPANSILIFRIQLLRVQ